MNLPELMQQADEWLFRLINSAASATWLDGPMRALRYAPSWIPLYVTLLLVFRKKMPRQFLYIVAASLLAFALADIISARWLKPTFGRVRPCYSEHTGFMVRQVVGCGGKYSMPSSHAANHFALAVLWFCTVRRFTGRKWRWLFLWVLAVCWAQVYVGVHYPADIAVGALTGTLIGFTCFKLLTLVLAWRPGHKNIHSLHRWPFLNTPGTQ